jgi:hypothetical protein
MGTQIVSREADVISPAVVMYRKVHQPLVSAVRYPVSYERRFQHAVAALSGDVVDAVRRKVQVTGQEPDAMIGFGYAGNDDRSMLVTISGKQMGVKALIKLLGKDQTPRFVYGRVTSHRSTLQSLRSAVCEAGSSRLVRREI